MTFSNRLYEVFVVLGNPSNDPAWAEPTWQQLAAAIDPLTHSTWGSAAVRSTQLANKPGSPNQRGISFGRIGWNKNGHRKWVHQNGHKDEGREFCSAEMWSPSWMNCQSEKRYPDSYFSMFNEKSVTQNAAFNPTFLLAVAQDLDPELLKQSRSCAMRIADILAALLRVRCHRKWAVGRDETTGRWVNNINDLTISGLFRAGRRHNQPVTTTLLDGVWEAF